jgi:hypothetical protein
MIEGLSFAVPVLFGLFIFLVNSGRKREARLTRIEVKLAKIETDITWIKERLT